MQETNVQKTARGIREHILTVCECLDIIRKELQKRARVHDASKLQDPELTIFAEFTPKLKGSTYGSNEYKQFCKDMQVALDHHYANNRHHPEHFKNGIHDMNLIDLIEMFCDWKAATLRHADGDIKKSIDINKNRFGIDLQLTNIFKNSVSLFEDVKNENV